MSDKMNLLRIKKAESRCMKQDQVKHFLILGIRSNVYKLNIIVIPT